MPFFGGRIGFYLGKTSRMRNLILLFCTLACFVRPAGAQSKYPQPRWGITHVVNFAQQLNYDPQFPENGKFIWNTLVAQGAGVFYHHPISRRFWVHNQVSYQVKGYKEIAQFAIVSIPGSFSESTFINSFRYLSLDIQPAWLWLDRPYLDAFVTGGFSADVLTGTRIGSNVWPINLFYPVNEYDRFRRLTPGFRFGVGGVLNDLLVVEGAFQRDLVPIMDKPNLRIWNWGFSVRMGLELGRLVEEWRG